MPKGRALSQEQVSKLLLSYRARPGDASAAAREAACDVRTARKAWDFGLTSTLGCERPLRDVIEQEQVETRARLEQMRAEQERQLSDEEAARRRKAAEQARTDATESRMQEAQMIRIARAGAAQLLASLTTIGKSTVVLGEKVRAALAETYSKEQITLPEANALVRLINSMATSMRQANDAALRAMEMERLLLGEPTNILGVVHAEALTLTEAEDRINAATEALQHAKTRGLIVNATQPAFPIPADPKLTH
jgi:hypothetical protein